MPTVLIVGCGSAFGHVHAPGWTEFTVDNNPAALPDFIDDVTRANFMPQQFLRGFFNTIFFENIDGAVFDTPQLCRTVLANATRLLAPGGQMVIWTAIDVRSRLAVFKHLLTEFGYRFRETDQQTLADVDAIGRLNLEGVPTGRLALIATKGARSAEI